ncbi:hypothetical protein KSP40_PGU010083 [Platanthera guangdongensis]|uniref:Uncharacterized protein n=1 Tax=Platanthera guangdongensis TaxID=2320717 RepID=A0ABR2LLP4_9ASPA
MSGGEGNGGKKNSGEGDGGKGCKARQEGSHWPLVQLNSSIIPVGKAASQLSDNSYRDGFVASPLLLFRHHASIIPCPPLPSDVKYEESLRLELTIISSQIATAGEENCRSPSFLRQNQSVLPSLPSGIRNMRSEDQQQHEAVNDLCALLLTALRSPLIPIPFAGTDSPVAPAIQSGLRRDPAASGRLPPMSPSGMASLMLGISLSLMFCGSVAFVIGFVMMPWVLSMAMLLYFLGIVYSVFGMCKAALISPASSPPR